ncbi:ankyrin repeat-containing domain protein [Scleroderma yunnanense]
MESTTTNSYPSPSQDDREDLLLSCRYGDLEDVQAFVAKYNAFPLADTLDDHGNTVLHMACGNGHVDILEYILPLVPPSLIAKQNNLGSTPLHWAAVNRHLAVAQKLVQFPSGPGVNLIDIKNTAGRSPLAEAEMAQWDDGAKWFVQVMNLDEIKEEEGDEQVDPSQAVEIEIQDAEGQVAKMKINGAIQ